MGVLTSKLFTDADGDALTLNKLEDCAVGRPTEVISHFALDRNQNGEHIRRVKQALQNIKDRDPSLGIPPFTVNGIYDPAFALAVAKYKEKRGIFNFANKVDNIIGVKTIRALDRENQGQLPVPIPPDPPRPEPNIPDTPPLVAPAGFRLSGWKITGIAGVLGTIPTPIPQLSAGGGVQVLTLENTLRKETATYTLDGVAASFGADLTKKLPFLKPVIDALKGRGGSFGPSQFPTFGSEIVVTPWVNEPVEAKEFACFAAITSLGAGALFAGSGNVIVFSIVPFIPLALIGTATIKGIGIFGSTGLSPPNASADAFHAKSFLKSVSSLS
jgi:hypothetical protein